MTCPGYVIDPVTQQIFMRCFVHYEKKAKTLTLKLPFSWQHIRKWMSGIFSSPEMHINGKEYNKLEV